MNSAYLLGGGNTTVYSDCIVGNAAALPVQDGVDGWSVTNPDGTKVELAK